MNYGWMVQQEHCGIDNISFYPIHPYDIFTNSIERLEGKEVDFTLVYSWNEEEEKLIEVAIISANITYVPFKQETLYTEQQMIGFAEWILNSDSKKVLTRTKESLLKEYIESLKQPKKD